MTRRKAPRGEAPEGLADLERKLGHAFANPALASQALTHRSFGTPHNERLEFLGDALLNCAVATLLYDRFSSLPEGDLSRVRAALVNQASLSEVALKLGLGDRLRLGQLDSVIGEFLTRNPGADDHGPDVPDHEIVCRNHLAAHRRPPIASMRSTDRRARSATAGSTTTSVVMVSSEGLPVEKDPKTALQEHLQGRRLALPRYSVTKTEGEAHDQTFIVECRVDDLGLVAEGRGASRRAAEQAAAEGLLPQLGPPSRRKRT